MEVSCVWHSIEFDGESPVLLISVVWSIFSLPLLTGPLWPWLVVLVKIISMYEINLHKNYTHSIALWTKKISSELHKNANVNRYSLGMLFPNADAVNNPRGIDMSLKINQNSANI